MLSKTVCAKRISGFENAILNITSWANETAIELQVSIHQVTSCWQDISIWQTCKTENVTYHISPDNYTREISMTAALQRH